MVASLARRLADKQTCVTSGGVQMRSRGVALMVGAQGIIGAQASIEKGALYKWPQIIGSTLLCETTEGAV
jgi:hypothetical protein